MTFLAMQSNGGKILAGARGAPQSPAPFDFAWSKTDANSLSYGVDGAAWSGRRETGRERERERERESERGKEAKRKKKRWNGQVASVNERERGSDHTSPHDAGEGVFETRPSEGCQGQLFLMAVDVGGGLMSDVWTASCLWHCGAARGHTGTD